MAGGAQLAVEAKRVVGRRRVLHVDAHEAAPDMRVFDERLQVLAAERIVEPEPEAGELDGDVRVQTLALDAREHAVVGPRYLPRLAVVRDLLAEDVDRRELALAVQAAHDSDGLLERRSSDVRRGECAHERLRHCRKDAGDRAVEERHRRRILGSLVQLSRMNPWRAALTSATASGKSTRMESRSASACPSAVPVTCPRASAADVSSTAVLSSSHSRASPSPRETR